MDTPALRDPGKHPRRPQPAGTGRFWCNYTTCLHMRMVCCFRIWTDADAEADADEIKRGSITPHEVTKSDLPKSAQEDDADSTTHMKEAPEDGREEEEGGDELMLGADAVVALAEPAAPELEAVAKEKAEADAEAEAEAEVEKALETVAAEAEEGGEGVPPKPAEPAPEPQAEQEAASGSPPSTAEEAPPAEQDDPAKVEKEPVAEKEPAPKEEEQAPQEEAPPSGSSEVLDPHAEAIKRVDEQLMGDGLPLTQVTSSDKRVVRKVFVNVYYGILTWEKEAIFGTKWERIKLADARVMCTDNVVKVGVAGKKSFRTFEASDESEASAVCDALVGHAKGEQEQQQEEAQEEAKKEAAPANPDKEESGQGGGKEAGGGAEKGPGEEEDAKDSPPPPPKADEPAAEMQAEEGGDGPPPPPADEPAAAAGKEGSNDDPPSPVKDEARADK